MLQTLWSRFSYIGNTTNMSQHLKEAHSSEYHGLKSSEEDLTDNLGYASCNISSSSIANKQIQITEAFTRTQPLPHS